MIDIEFRRGDTFLLDCTIENPDGSPVDITGWAVAGNIETPRQVSIATLTTTITDSANGAYTLLNSSTGAWPLGLSVMNIRYTDLSGRIVSAKPVSLNIIA